jgi:eukaryotic-like serine/threonine-protein kinase
MISEQSSALEPEQRLDEILASFLRDAEAGQLADRRALLARHPEFATELTEFFGDFDRVDRLTEPLRSVRHAVADALASSDTVDEKPAGGLPTPKPSKIRCPTCHNPIQLAKESDEVLCPGCGSSFRLREASHTNTTSGMKSMGRFQLLERLGLGSFGAVWKARDTELDRIVALKIPHTGLLTENEELQRFQREARATAQLRHPNIVTVHEVARLNNLPVIVAEFVAGVPLKELLDAKQLSFRQAAALTAQLADALDYAHSLGVVHRDVKPANVMLLRGPKQQNPAGESASQSNDELAEIGKPMLLDFGLALRDTGETTMTVDGHVLGTPAYMSPEQAAGQSHKADRRSDVYSVGVVLYQMLAGELPFRGSQMMLRQQVIHEEPKALRKVNGQIPRDLETICMKCLRKEPVNRYDTAGSLAADLRRFLAGEAIAARRMSSVEQIVRWVRRRPAVAALLLACAVAVLGLAGTVVGWLFNEELKTANLATQSALEKSDSYLFFNRLGLAERSWWGNNPGRTRELLAEIAQDSPGRIGWEWHYLDGLAHAEALALHGHKDTVQRAVYSPDGKLLASGDRDGKIILWNALTGEKLKGLEATYVNDLVFTADSNWLVSAGLGGKGGMVRLWDLRSILKPGDARHVDPRVLLDQKEQCYKVVLSPDGKRLAVGCVALAGHHSQVKLLEFPAGREVFSLQTTHEMVLAVAFSSDGKQIVTGTGGQGESLDKSPGTVQVWDAKTGEEIRHLKGHKGYVNAVAFSRDGKLLASAGTDRTIFLWDTSTFGEIAKMRGHAAVITSLAFRPSDGNEVATADELGEVKVWDAAAREERFTLRGHTAAVYSVAYHPDGHRLVSAGMDRVVRIWEATNGLEARNLRHGGSALSLAFSPDGLWLVSGTHDHTVYLWDLSGKESPRRLGEVNGGVWSLAFSPNGKLVAAGSGDWVWKEKRGQVTVWDLPSGRKVWQKDAHVGLVCGVAFSPDGKTLATGGGENLSSGDVNIWDVASGEKLHCLPQTKGVRGVAFSRDGKRLAAVVCNECVARIWDAQTLKELFELSLGTDNPWSLAFSPDGTKLLTGGTEQSVKIWDTANGKLLSTLQGHLDDIRGMAFSPDGTRAVSACLDQTLRLWDVAAGKELLTLRGHTSYIYVVAFSPNGDLIASASDDGTVKIWDGRPRGKK